MTRTLSIPPPSLAPVAPAVADHRVALLAEVDFKWLMAGQGWWIDTERLHTDPSYCASVIGLALASPCGALRECAALVQTLAGSTAPRT